MLFTLIILVCATSRMPSQAAPGSSRGLSLSAAVKSTLNNHPTLLIQEAQLALRRGQKRQATGAFDSVLQTGIGQARVDTPLTVYEHQQETLAGSPIGTLNSRLTVFNLGWSKLFRNGVTVTPSFGLSRTTDNATNLTGINTSTIGLGVTIPILRGRGRTVVAAPEEAAQIEVDASSLDLVQLAAQLITNTAASYWQLVAARRQLDIAIDAENRGRVYVANVQALIEADEVPRNDVHEVTANLDDRQATRIAAEQALVAAQEQLALDMGLQPSEMLQTSETTDPFPMGKTETLPSDTRTAMLFYLNQAFRNRADYQSAQRRSLEARVLRTASRNTLLPQFTLSLGAGYNGLQEGHAYGTFFAPPVSAAGSPNLNLSFNFTRPFGNNIAEGLLQQNDAAVRQAELQATDVARSIAASVITSVSAVRNAFFQAKKARESVISFQEALAAQRERYRLGTGSVVDILTVEDKLNAELLAEVGAELSYALALVQFRFSTGTLISADQRLQNFDPGSLLTLPFPAETGN